MKAFEEMMGKVGDTLPGADAATSLELSMGDGGASNSRPPPRTNITVLDIAPTALDKARRRLGDRAALVTWLVADVAQWTPFRTVRFVA